jgi:hypothetical protein
MVYAGVHEDLRMSRQISPVLKSTFGWQIGVTKRTVGGERGYAGGMWMSRSQQPPERVNQYSANVKGGGDFKEESVSNHSIWIVVGIMLGMR